VVQFYNDGVVQAVTFAFAYLIYGRVSCRNKSTNFGIWHEHNINKRKDDAAVGHNAKFVNLY